MSALTRRLDKLETKAPTACPMVKRWLGILLTPEEEAEADRISAEPSSGDVDWSNYPSEVREWLEC